MKQTPKITPTAPLYPAIDSISDLGQYCQRSRDFIRTGNIDGVNVTPTPGNLTTENKR